jgi:hypothetical protein
VDEASLREVVGEALGDHMAAALDPELGDVSSDERALARASDTARKQKAAPKKKPASKDEWVWLPMSFLDIPPKVRPSDPVFRFP